MSELQSFFPSGVVSVDPPLAVPRVDLTPRFARIQDRLDAFADSGALAMAPPAADQKLKSAFGGQPILELVRDDLTEHLVSSPGFVLVKLQGQPFDETAFQHRHLIAGYSLGANINRHSEEQKKTALFEISPHTKPGYYGNGENSSTIGPHTDGSGVPEIIDVLGLSCLSQTDGVGGATLICRAEMAIAALAPRDQEMLAQPWPRTNPYEEVTTSFQRRAIAIHNGRFEFSYHPQRVRDGLDLCGESTLETMQLLARLDAALWRFVLPIKLKPGELLLVDNRRVGHARIGFKHNPNQRRCLKRQWIHWSEDHLHP